MSKKLSTKQILEENLSHRPPEKTGKCESCAP